MTSPCIQLAPSTPSAILDRYRFLGCPECHQRLWPGEEAIRCVTCNVNFAIRHGVPILLPANVSFDQQATERVHQSPPGFLRRKLNYGIHPYEGRKQLLSACRGQILAVGGGPKRETPRYINLNLQPMENVDIVGDAASLPCTDNSLDGVVCNAVLEHVRDPWKVMAEINRSLKPGGHLLIEVPFLQHYHPSPQDFYRFTREGILELCRDFKPISVGLTCGPMGTFVEMTESFLVLLFGNSPVVKGATRLALYPVRIFDLLLNRMERAHLVANGFYFFGVKPGEPHHVGPVLVPDHEIAH
jgi:SAM-dependent methyltransferase